MKMVSKLRKTELRHLRNFSYLSASFAFTFFCAPFLVSNIIILLVDFSSTAHLRKHDV